VAVGVRVFRCGHCGIGIDVERNYARSSGSGSTAHRASRNKSQMLMTSLAVVVNLLQAGSAAIARHQRIMPRFLDLRGNWFGTIGCRVADEGLGRVLIKSGSCGNAG
jgi:hypothetical protein